MVPCTMHNPLCVCNHASRRRRRRRFLARALCYFACIKIPKILPCIIVTRTQGARRTVVLGHARFPFLYWQEIYKCFFSPVANMFAVILGVCQTHISCLHSHKASICNFPSTTLLENIVFPSRFRTNLRSKLPISYSTSKKLPTRRSISSVGLEQSEQ